MPKLLVYIHGFNSSPKSAKAQLVSGFLKREYADLEIAIPQLSPYPAEAMAQLEAIVEQYPEHEKCFIGSSMGGYMSTWLMNKYGGRAVLINPAVAPYKLFQDYLGEQHNPYTKVTYNLTAQHLDELIALETATIDKLEDFWVLLQTADEVLDYRLAEEKYAQAKLTIEEGGSHGFDGFERHLCGIVEFLKIA